MRTAADHELLGQIIDYYHRVLGESPDALSYLARRRIDHPEAIDVFRLGYADRTLGLRLPDKRRKDGAELRGRLGALGIFRASGLATLNRRDFAVVRPRHAATFTLLPE